MPLPMPITTWDCSYRWQQIDRLLPAMSSVAALGSAFKIVTSCPAKEKIFGNSKIIK